MSHTSQPGDGPFTDMILRAMGLRTDPRHVRRQEEPIARAGVTRPTRSAAGAKRHTAKKAAAKSRKKNRR